MMPEQANDDASTFGVLVAGSLTEEHMALNQATVELARDIGRIATVLSWWPCTA